MDTIGRIIMLVEILVGPIGAGKSTYAASIPGAVIINQDRQGPGGHKVHYKHALNDKVPHIIIDRMNFNKEQRKRYIKLALEAGYQVKITTLTDTFEECLARVIARENHPTIAKGDEVTACKVLNFFFSNYEPFTEDEICLDT